MRQAMRMPDSSSQAAIIQGKGSSGGERGHQPVEVVKRIKPAEEKKLICNEDEEEKNVPLAAKGSNNQNN